MEASYSKFKNLKAFVENVLLFQKFEFINFKMLKNLGIIKLIRSRYI